jgi:aspartyl protease family protein
MSRQPQWLVTLAIAGLLVCPALRAQTVALAGMLGGKALLIVDGAAPKSVAVGETYKGVKINATEGDNAQVEVGGKRFTLHVGDAPASVGGGTADAGGGRVVLSAGSGGHFVSPGQINGKTVQFVVDTGASLVTLSTADAQRIGLNYQSGQPVQLGTANGVALGWRVKLAQVRLGDVVVYDIDSVVSPGFMPFVLLGNSFLTHFQMNRNNDQMTLDKRF